MQRVFRVEPKGRPEDYKTYAIKAPRSTHTRAATCAEVECANRERGFRVTADVSTALGVQQAQYIMNHSWRAFARSTVGDLVTFTFPAGQDCFTQHRKSLEREPLFVVRDGDYRGNPRGTPTVARRADEWVDDFATHQDNLQHRLNRG